MLTLAQDRSLRSFDVDGRLRVQASNISKAMVSPYYGHEIPRAKELGLQPNRIYNLLRDPDELKKAADSFSNIPVLLRHESHSADDPKHDIVCGTTGKVTFDGTYLVAEPLTVWTSEAIKLIESGAQAQLSSSYRYECDLTPGTYDGVAYDGVMRSIKANHVALVQRGRAGPDVHVADELSPELIKTMRFANLAEKLKTFLKPDLDVQAFDAAIAEVTTETEAEKAAAAEAQKAAVDSAIAEALKAAGVEPKKIEPPKEPEITKAAMDAAIAKASADATAKAIADVNALHEARRAVEPLCGVVAKDSADEVYKFALDHAKVPTEGVHPSAFPAMVAMLKTQQAPRPRVAMDSAASARVESIWTGLTRNG